VSVLTRKAAQALAKRLNWEPADHDGKPGEIPDGAWDQWSVFEALAGRRIAWTVVDQPAWRLAYAADWAPRYDALVEGARYLIVQHDWHGFPDPPEWALHVLDPDTGDARCLGCFDEWPEAWTS
jgi:hypothetical protein